MKTCYVVGAGDALFKNVSLKEEDMLICADGGLEKATALNKKPDFIIGDFDSLGYVPDIAEKKVLPCEKDYSDMFYAVNEGISRGFERFVLLGALGGDRWDHSVANIQLLHYLSEKGAEAYILHNDTVFTVIKDKKLVFSGKEKGYISVFSLSDKSEGVFLKGLKYEVENITLMNSLSKGLSNEFKNGPATVSVRQGALLVIFKGEYKDCTFKECDR